MVRATYFYYSPTLIISRVTLLARLTDCGTTVCSIFMIFLGAHFHCEAMDRRTMSVIRHTTNSLAQQDLASPLPSITLTAQVSTILEYDEGGGCNNQGVKD